MAQTDESRTTAQDGRGRRKAPLIYPAPRGVQFLKRTVTRVQGGQPDRLGGGADLLRDPVGIPRPARAGLDSRADRERRDADADRQPRAGRARPAQEIFTSAIENLQKNQGAAGIMLIVGLALAIWSASGYVAAFMRASNAIYDVEEGRPIWKSLPTRVWHDAGPARAAGDHRRWGRPHRRPGGARLGKVLGIDKTAVTSGTSRSGRS